VKLRLNDREEREEREAAAEGEKIVEEKKKGS
jgi:hypothetical protein